MASKKQPKPQMPAHDFRWGMYRRVYSCWNTGKRINAVSEGAALLFLHLHGAADDFGNMRGERYMVKAHAAPIRDSLTPAKIERLLDELAKTAPPLIKFYEIGGERFIHIMDFIKRQPAGKNGRRVMRFPREPSEFGDSDDLGFTKLVTSGSNMNSNSNSNRSPLPPSRRGKRLRPREAAKQQAAQAQEQARHDSSTEYLAKIERLRAEAAKPKGKVGGESPGLPRHAGQVGNGSDAPSDGG